MLRFALRNLFSRKLRSLLALLGLTVAIVGMVGLFSVAEGIDSMVTEAFDRIPGLIVMQAGAPIPLFSRIPAQWQEELEQIPGVGVVCPEVLTRVNVINGKRIISPPRFFIGTDLVARRHLRHGVYEQAMVSGRFLTTEDRGTNHMVISRQIAEEFNAQVGDTLRVNGFDLEIVGIYHFGSLLLDVAVLLDIGSVRSMSQLGPETVSSFYVEQDGTVPDDVLLNQIRKTFRQHAHEIWQPSSLLGGGGGENPVIGLVNSIDRLLRGERADDVKSATNPAASPASAASADKPPAPAVPPRDEDDLPVEVRSSSDWAERFDEFSADLDIFLTIMTGIGVTIAVLSIVNTMLMSVSERIIEFGILKANGWSKADIMKLITCESAVLGVGGGVLGSLLGWVGTQVINWKWPEHVHLFASPRLLLFSLAFSTCLGIAGGLYPAIWATRMSPMDAIRRG